MVVLYLVLLYVCMLYYYIQIEITEINANRKEFISLLFFVSSSTKKHVLNFVREKK